jgi:hypothetical protein
MANITYSISFDLGTRMDITAAINKAVFPMLHQAVNAVGQQTASNWKEAVYRAKLWSGEKDAYANSIEWKMTGDFSGYVEATYEQAREIETGRPARDLKKMLNTSLKVRRTESGKRFLVIPMRHNTPGNNAHANAMPNSVHSLAKNMEKSRVVSAGLRPVGEVTKLSPKSGMHASAKQSPYLSNQKTQQQSMTAKMGYSWGDRLSKAALLQGGASKAEAKRYAGMTRMETSTPGGGKSSSFLSFRIMMDGSSGWVVPAQPGQFIAKKVTEDMAPKAQAAFAEAVKRTV